jgi:RimJ/RimL family protein N-acetyltransferase
MCRQDCARTAKDPNWPPWIPIKPKSISMKAGVIHSERLDLIPLTPDFLRASLQGNILEAEQLLEHSLPDGWPDCSDVLKMRLRQLENDPELQPWLLRAISLRRGRVMVGHVGCHTAPGADYLQPYSPGAVEFGFQIFPPFRRQGYACEASLALMRWASAERGITNFILSISPDNTASQALAAKLGFTRIGSHIDEVDGLEEILEGRFPAVDLPPK